MSKALVAYFSASGVTAKVASKLAEAAGADLFEIKPEVPYTKEDLNWQDKNSRSSVEMRDTSSRPAVAGKVENMGGYDVIFLGFPIWWYVAPHITNSFLEGYDMSGKKIILFATSGGSGFGKSVAGPQDSCPGATVMEGKILNGCPSIDELKEWVDSLTL